MKHSFAGSIVVLGIALVLFNCTQGVDTLSSQTSASKLVAVGQTSGQLASGTSFSIISSANTGARQPDQAQDKGHGKGYDKHAGMPLDGTNLLAPTNELLAIVEAESAGDVRGFHMAEHAGATITHYDANGNVVTLPQPPAGERGPEGCSFSGHQFPKQDSVLALIAKTVVDFGTGVTVKHDTISITRAGQIEITRSKSAGTLTETITFSSYSVNGNVIQGTKTRVHSFDATTGIGKTTSNVTNGKILFSDGTNATWTGSRERNSNLVLDSASHHPVSGLITTIGSTTVTASDGTLIYSHNVTKAITEDVSCDRRRHSPVSGTVETIYRAHTVTVDFGSGSCTNQTITVTVDGVTTTKTIGG